MATSSEPIVELRGITKSYPGVRALRDVSLSLRPGTITALAGENGAGKSTFIKVLSGAEMPDSGAVLLDGQELASDPRTVIDAGVSVIYQELTDVPDMTILDNVMLGRKTSTFGVTRRRDNEQQTRQALARVGLEHLDPGESIRTLSLAQRQLIEVARCLARHARVLVFDEPTSSLPESEVEALLSTIEHLREQGLAILYVSHHLDELFRIADDIVVLREGQVVGNAPTTEWTEASLVRAMLAKELDQAYPWEPRPTGDVRLRVEGLTAPGVRNADLVARSGEIVGLIGLAGAGRTEILKAIAGVTKRSAGRVEVDGRVLVPGSITAARQSGVVYAPEDRKVEGLILESSVENNIAVGLYDRTSRFGWVNGLRQRRLAQDGVAEFGVKVDSLHQLVGRLSGGNQQKVILARVAASRPTVVLLDDPTRGVDIGAKSSIHQHVLEMAKDGATIIVTSSDTEEVLAVADRAYVMRSGRIVGEVARTDFSRENVLLLATAG
jgi:ABC-type sugar transport system ATPase subunit